MFVCTICNFHSFIRPKLQCMLPPEDKEHDIRLQTKKRELKLRTLNLTLGANIIVQVRQHGVLGVTIDEELKWQPQIDNVCKQFEIYSCWVSLGIMLIVIVANCYLKFTCWQTNYASAMWINMLLRLASTTPILSTTEQQN